MPQAVLIAGISTRAAAESAARAGFDVTAIDAFGDLDAHPSVRSLSSARDFGAPFTPQAVARAARALRADAVAYLANFENHPDAVRDLAAGRALWGNPPDVLEQVRNPLVLTNAFRRRSIAAPSVIVNTASDSVHRALPYVGRVPRRVAIHRPVDPPANDPNAPSDWLLKPLASGGGHRVRRWRPERGQQPEAPAGWYLQQWIEGVPGSIVFVAAGGRAMPVGLSRQLIGEAAFGASGYRYCGNILAASGDPQFGSDERLVRAASALATVVSEEFGLVGVNGVDFIARDGVLHPVEVNPRWCGSMDLVERVYGLSLFGAHVAACRDSILPAFDLLQARRGVRAVGKAIVFARGDVVMGDTRAWLADATIRDVPHPGEWIAAHHPICTVLAEGPDAATCYQALVRRAERLYAAVTC